MSQRDYLETRLTIYALLRQLFQYPIGTEALIAARELSLPETHPLYREWKNLQSSIPADINPDWEEQLRIEMTRLLEGPGRTPAPPYASFYLDGMRLMGYPARRAQQTYLEYGVLPEASGLPADHLATELGFLAYLAEQGLTLESDPKPFQVSLAFLQEQVQPWVTSFCVALENAAQEAFFIRLAQFTRAYLEEDATWLQTVLANEYTH